MWPFQDDEPAWVKARDERYRMIQELILENVPNILKMPEGYYFGYDIPTKIRCQPAYGGGEYNGGCVIEYVQYKLIAERHWLGPMLCIQTITISPRKMSDGFDFNLPVRSCNFQELYLDGQLEKWKVELSQQLPVFFEQLRADISYKLRRKKYERDEEKKRCRRSVDTASGIIDCLRSKLSR